MCMDALGRFIIPLSADTAREVARRPKCPIHAYRSAGQQCLHGSSSSQCTIQVMVSGVSMHAVAGRKHGLALEDGRVAGRTWRLELGHQVLVCHGQRHYDFIPSLMFCTTLPVVRTSECHSAGPCNLTERPRALRFQGARSGPAAATRHRQSDPHHSHQRHAVVRSADVAWISYCPPGM